MPVPSLFCPLSCRSLFERAICAYEFTICDFARSNSDRVPITTQLGTNIFPDLKRSGKALEEKDGLP